MAELVLAVDADQAVGAERTWRTTLQSIIDDTERASAALTRLSATRFAPARAPTTRSAPDSGTAAAAAAAARLAREQAAAQRALERVQSSLGGAERGAAQYAARERDLNQALAAGTITQQRHADLLSKVAANTTEAAVDARSFGAALALAGGPAAQLAAQLSLAHAAIVKTTGGFSTLGIAATITVAAAGAVIALGHAAVEAAEKLDDMEERAQSLGITVEALQHLEFAGTIVGAKNAEQAIGIFVRNLGQAERGTGKAAEALGILGLRLSDLKHLGVEQQLGVIADRFVELSDTSKQASVTMDLFGRGGRQFANLLKLGSAGIKELADEADRLGIVFDTATVKSAGEVADRFKVLGAVASATKTRIAIELLPAINDVSTALLHGAESASKFIAKLLDLPNTARFSEELARINKEIADLDASSGKGNFISQWFNEGKRKTLGLEQLTLDVRLRMNTAETKADLDKIDKEIKGQLETLQSHGVILGPEKVAVEQLNLALSESKSKREGLKAAGLASLFDGETHSAKAEADALREKNKELAAGERAELAVSDSLATTQRAVDALRGEIAARREGAGALQDFQREQAISNALREQEERLASVGKTLFAEEAAAIRDRTGAQFDLNAQLAEEQRIRATKAADDAETTRLAREAGQAVQKQSEASARAMAQPFENAARAIQTDIAGAIRTGLDGSLTDAKDFWQEFVSLGKDALAQFAALEITGPILQRIAGGASGGGSSFGSGGGFFGSGGFGGLLGNIGGTNATSGAPNSADRDEVLAALKKTAAAGEETASNTSGMLGVLGKGLSSVAAGGAGLFAGIGAGQQFGLRGGAGSLVAGTVGAGFGGAFGGPIGAAAGGFAGGLIGGELLAGLTDIFKGKSPFGDQDKLSGAARGAILGTPFVMFGGSAFGALIGALLSDTDKTRAAIRTSADDTGFRSSGSTRSPFGFVGFDAARTEGLSATVGKKLTEIVAAFDAQIAASLDPSRIGDISNLLQTTQALRESAKSFDREFSSLLVDRAATIARRDLELGGVGSEAIDQLISGALSKKGSAGRKPEDIIKSFQEITGLVTQFSDGIRTLRGDDIAEGAQAIRDLNKAAGELVPIALAIGKSFEEVEAARLAGIAKLGTEFTKGLHQDILGIDDPFRAAINNLVDERERLSKEALALGVDFSEVANRIAASSRQLVDTALQPVSDVIERIRIDRATPLENFNILGSRFDQAALGNDPNKLAAAAADLLSATEAAQGRTSAFFEKESAVLGQLELFSSRLRAEADEAVAATVAQTAAVTQNQEQQILQLSDVILELQKISEENARLRNDMRLIMARQG